PWQTSGVGLDGTPQAILQIFNQLSAVYLAQPVAEKEPQRRIVALSENLFRELGAVKFDTVLRQQGRPLFEVKRIAVYKHAIHVEYQGCWSSHVHVHWTPRRLAQLRNRNCKLRTATSESPQLISLPGINSKFKIGNYEGSARSDSRSLAG